MFCTLAFLAMRQQQRQATLQPPLSTSRSNKLVYDDLRDIRKVPELCFPDCQCFRKGSGVTVFETQYGLFRQQGINHGEMPMPAFVVMPLERNKSAAVVLAMQYRMTMKKSTTAGILATQTHVMTFIKQ